MNNRSLWLAMVILATLASSVAIAAGDDDPGALLHRYGAGGSLAVGDWLLEFGGFGWLAPKGTVTGLAFGTGRAELAYCTADDTAGSELWLISLADLSGGDTSEVGAIGALARLLWRAPEGQALTGSLWWAPNGSSIAFLARSGGTADLLTVDYVSGAATTLARNVNVVDAAWEHGGRRIAYVTESQGERRLWLQPTPPGEPRQIGEGGFNLRWSLDGALTWLGPDSQTTRSERLWDPQSGEVTTIGSRPARGPDAQWSPDGLLCAALHPADGSDEKQLVIYPTASQTGEGIPLPEAHPERLLGWSPDSRLLLLLTTDGWLLGVSAQPPGPSLTEVLLAKGRRHTVEARTSLAGIGRMDPSCGPPAWNSGSDLFAYLSYQGHISWMFPHLVSDSPFGYLIVQAVNRKYYAPPQAKDLAKAKVDFNMKNIALALQMYLADNNDAFPPVGDTEALLPILVPYVRNLGIFMRPGTEDDLVVHYVVPSSLRWADCGDVTSMPVAVVDYASDFYSIAFGDGHVWTFDRTPENEQMLEDWWAEFDALRAEDPSAPPPPFPPEE